jgi:hypothetical protein
MSFESMYLSTTTVKYKVSELQDMRLAQPTTHAVACLQTQGVATSLACESGLGVRFQTWLRNALKEKLERGYMFDIESNHRGSAPTPRCVEAALSVA